MRAWAATLALMVLAGCSGSAGDAPPVASPSPTSLPDRLTANQVLLFQHSAYRMAVYDVQKHAIVTQTTGGQVFQYFFPDRGPLFTTGDSVTYGFTVKRLEGNVIKTVLAAEKNQGIFPVDTYDGRYLFAVVNYSEPHEITDQHLAILDGTRLTPYPHVTDAISAGAVVKDRLFYTTPAGDDYALRSVDLTDPQARPKTVRAVVKTPAVQAYRGRLIVDGRYPGLSKRFDCTYYCYADDDRHMLVSLYVTKDADLEVDVIDMSTGTVTEKTNGDVIDVQVVDGAVVVYMLGKIVTLKGVGK